jgi:hypothetical protein
MTAVNQEYYEFYVKLVYTCQTINFQANPNNTIAQFIADLKNRASTDFNIVNTDDIEVVEAGQPHNVNGRDAEMAPILEPSPQTLRDKYGNNHSSVAFYIRAKNKNYVTLDQESITITNVFTVENSQESTQLDDILQDILPPIPLTNSCCYPFGGL